MQICGRRKSSLPPGASAESSSLHQRRVCQPGEQILGAPSGIEASVSAGCCLSISLLSSQLLCSVLTSSCSSLSWQHSFSTSPRQDRERHPVSPRPETGALRSPSAAQSESRCCCAGAGWCCSCQGASSSPLHELQHLVAPESEACVCELSAPLSSQFPKCDARDSCGMSNLDCQGSGK